MNLDSVISRVERAVDDASFGRGDIRGYINDGLEAVAGALPLPSLEKTAVVETVADQNWLELPSDFYMHLRYVQSEKTNRRVQMYPDIARLYERTPVTEGGLVRRCTAVGGRLYYSPTPASPEELKIVYHARPERYTASGTVTDYIPAHIGPALLEAYACKEIWDLIEDGVDGAKINTDRWEQKHAQRLEALMLFLGPFYNRPVHEMETLDVMRL